MGQSSTKEEKKGLDSLDQFTLVRVLSKDPNGMFINVLAKCKEGSIISSSASSSSSSSSSSASSSSSTISSSSSSASSASASSSSSSSSSASSSSSSSSSSPSRTPLTDLAIITLKKTPFLDVQIPSLISSSTNLQLNWQNDIYKQFAGHTESRLNPLNVNIIYPATELEIKKNESANSEHCYIRETYDDYKNITLPWIESLPSSALTWVENILDKKAETERRVVEDLDPEVGFMLNYDLKWDRKSMLNLYCLAMCLRRGIRSMRDLTGKHLPLLKNIREKCLKAVGEQYNVSPSQLRLYLHYIPSYMHLHVHVTATSFDAPGIHAGRAHLLDDVIDELTADPDIYQKKTMSIVLPVNHPLVKAFRNAKKDPASS
eukprot:TRINITY_DN183_c2_g1_i1.p1 TRINITY_DN183_c2_g1~~TRINITY_DN183_c2_g1_i1.p1  ORF type:complete len:375 (-),score=143.68 TRINITY_DN183_c2_g1_i1:194-1318(-)